MKSLGKENHNNNNITKKGLVQKLEQSQMLNIDKEDDRLFIESDSTDREEE